MMKTSEPPTSQPIGGSMNVTIYCRISLDRTGEMLGVERQEAECRAYCERRGWTVREVLVDNDISATTGKRRPAFEKLLKSNPEAIVVWHTDRLVRLTRELERVIDLKVNIYALHAGDIDLSTPAGRATAKTITAWAEYEGEQKALRQKSGHLQRAKAGKPWWNTRPFGFEMDGKHRTEEAKILRTLYRDLLRGVTLADLTRRLNRDGVLTSYGNTWTSAHLRQLLISPRNAGIRTHHGEEVGPGNWKAIIPEDQFRAVERLLRNPARYMGGGGPRKGMLVGIAECGGCGSKVRQGAVGQRRADGTYRKAYLCPKGCTSATLDVVDQAIGAIMVTRFKDPDFLAPLLPKAESLDLLRSEQAALTRAMEELGEDYADGLVQRAEFRKLRTRQNEAMANLEQRMAKAMQTTRLSGLPPLPQLARDWFNNDLVPVEVKRAAIEVFVKVTLVPRRKGIRDWLPERDLQLDWVESLEEDSEVSE